MAQTSFGTLLKLGDGLTPETFTTIAEVGDITPPDIKVAAQEITSHSSPGAVNQKIPDTIDMGTVSFPINWDPVNATHNMTTGLGYLAINRIIRNFHIVWPNPAGTTWLLPGFISRFHPTGAVKGKLSADVEITITGQCTLA